MKGLADALVKEMFWRFIVVMLGFVVLGICIGFAVSKIIS